MSRLTSIVSRNSISPKYRNIHVNALNISEAGESQNMWFPYICTSMYVTVQLFCCCWIGFYWTTSAENWGNQISLSLAQYFIGSVKPIFCLAYWFLSVYLFIYLSLFSVPFDISLSSPRQSPYVFNGYPILMCFHKILWYRMHIF